MMRRGARPAMASMLGIAETHETGEIEERGREPGSAGGGGVGGWATGIGIGLAGAVLLASWWLGSPATATVPTPAPTPQLPVTMLRIDPETNRVVAEVRDRYLGIGGNVGAVVVDGRLWQFTVAHAIGRNLETGELVRVHTLPGNTTSTAVAFGSLWHLTNDLLNAALLRADPRSAQIMAEIPVEPDVVDFAIGQGDIWLLTRGGQLLEVDPQRNEVVAMHETDVSQPTFMAPVGEDLWICQCVDGRLVRYSPRTGDRAAFEIGDLRPSASLRGNRVLGEAEAEVDDRTIWLVDGEAATITPFDTVLGELGAPIEIPPDAQYAGPSAGVAVGLGSIWLASGRAVHRIEIDTGQVRVIPAPEGVVLGGIAVDQESGMVWAVACDC